MFCFKFHPVHLFKLILLLCSHVKYLFDLFELTEKETIKLNLQRKNDFDLDWLTPAVCQSKAPLLGAGTSATET